MLFGQNRDQLRQYYYQAWSNRRAGMPLEPLQAQIVAVIEQHPEYQPLLEDQDKALGREYLPELGETNPFLHMGMHLAIQEQVSTDRPAGVRALYSELSGLFDDHHQLEHRLMECLAEMFWRAQRDSQEPDETAYLACIRATAEQLRNGEKP